MTLCACPNTERTNSGREYRNLLVKGGEELRRLLNAHADALGHSVTAELTPNYRLGTSVRGLWCRISCAGCYVKVDIGVSKYRFGGRGTV